MPDTYQTWSDDPGPLVIHPEPWVKDAACATVGSDAWFPERGSELQTAQSICAGCPVREQCLEFALRNNEEHGIWGGLSTLARKRLQRGLPPAPAKAAKAKREQSVKRRPWSVSEDAWLMELVAAGVPRPEIAERLDRTLESVYARVNRLRSHR